MIADDLVARLYRSGRAAQAATFGRATCVEVPFSLVEPESKLVPRSSDGKIHAPWARPPYPFLLLVSNADPLSRVAVLWIREFPITAATPALSNEVWRADAGLILIAPDRTALIQAARIGGAPDGTVARIVNMDERETPDEASRAMLMVGAAQLGVEAPPDLADASERALAGGLLSIVTTTLALMNCKNVRLSEARTTSRQQRRQAERSGRPVPFTVRTLLVHPEQSAQTHGISGNGDSRVALHWVRGHFKHYDETNKLFGKYTGAYWWSPHLSGDKAAGVVVKDYRIAP